MKSSASAIAKNLIYVAIFLIPFYFFRFSLLGIPTNIFEVAVFLSFLTTIYYLLSTKTKPLFTSIWPYLFVAISFLSVFFADDRTKAFGIFKGWFVVPLILFWVVINTFSQKDIKNIIKPLLYSGLIVSVWAILQRAGVVGLLFYQKSDLTSFTQYLDQGRAFGPFESPNYLAMFLVPVLFLALFLLKDKRSRLLSITTLILGCTAVVLSKSAGGYFAIALPISWYGFSLINSAKSLPNWVKTAGSIIFRALPIVIIYLVYQKLISDPLRLDIWRYAWQMIREHWLFGIGLGGFQDKIALYSVGDGSFQVHGLPYALHPHNLFLAIWANLGIIGLVVFVFLLLALFRRLSKNKGEQSLILGMAAASILLHGLVDTTYFKNDLSAIFWLILALAYLPPTFNEKTSV